METTMTIQQVAEAVEAKLNDTLSFEMGQAHIYGTDGVETTFVSAQPDVYDLLLATDSQPAKDSPFVALVTTGWGAPINQETGECDGAPSAHPQRRRVRLTVVANATDTYSIIRFADNADEIVGDDGQATGSLADAVRLFVQG